MARKPREPERAHPILKWPNLHPHILLL
jgi:hypothetical protein